MSGKTCYVLCCGFSSCLLPLRTPRSTSLCTPANPSSGRAAANLAPAAAQQQQRFSLSGGQICPPDAACPRSLTKPTYTKRTDVSPAKLLEGK
mmetsp:Transcript_6091/g.14145  ORF Transcript_6091/g.14145 Transcript_6091/m.14145 type:complete len:93 (-) Transcript_6091:6-284(-)